MDDFKSEKILAKDAEIGTVYVVRGGTAIHSNTGKEVSWGFDRVRAYELTDAYLKVETPWDTICDLPLDYPLYTTTEKEIRQVTIIRTRDREKTREMPFQEAIDLGFEKMGDVVDDDDEPKLSKRSQASIYEARVIDALTTDEGEAFSSIAKKVGTNYQTIRHIVNKITQRDGYSLVKVDGNKYKLVK